GGGTTPNTGGGSCAVGDIQCACDTILEVAGRCGFADFLEDDFFEECYQADVNEIANECAEEGLPIQACWDALIGQPLACIDATCSFEECFDIRVEQRPDPVPPGGPEFDR